MCYNLRFLYLVTMRLEGEEMNETSETMVPAAVLAANASWIEFEEAVELLATPSTTVGTEPSKEEA